MAEVTTNNDDGEKRLAIDGAGGKPLFAADQPVDPEAVPLAPKPDVVPPELASPAQPVAKPTGSGISRFKSKQAATMSHVTTLQPALPHHSLSQAKDYVRLHPDKDAYWSDELCFVSVPIIGDARNALHLVLEDLAMTYLSPDQIKRFRLALASKPGDAFFLCHVPTQNLDNSWNKSNQEACEKAISKWTKAGSLKAANQDKYEIKFAEDEDAFPPIQWPNEPLDVLIDKAFAGLMIEEANHPALLRLRGAKVPTK
jgi:hypothetical protein